MNNSISIRLLLAYFIFSFSSSSIEAQTISYDDVAVIVNDSSETSVAIGNYYASAHGIPMNRIIHVNISTNETIDTVVFRDFQAQLEAGLMASGALDTLNYLVTTKGLPLRISVDGSCEAGFVPGATNVGKCTSLESEISLILGPESDEILEIGNVFNLYRSANTHFDRDSTGYFIVSRLDGFTESDVISLIDRSGPGQTLNIEDVNIVIDYAGFSPSTEVVFLFRNNQIADSLSGLGINVINDTNGTTSVSGTAEVVGYSGAFSAAFNSNSNFEWAPGGIADLLVDEGSAFSFHDSLIPSMHEFSGHLIQDGATGVSSTVFPTFFSTTLQPSVFLPRYFDTTAVPRYTLGEAFYMAVQRLSYHSVLIGDPKTSISGTTMSIDDGLDIVKIQLYPNPTYNLLTIQGENVELDEIHIFNLLGQEMSGRTSIVSRSAQSITLDISILPTGIYFVKTRTSAGKIKKI